MSHRLRKMMAWCPYHQSWFDVMAEVAVNMEHMANCIKQTKERKGITSNVVMIELNMIEESLRIDVEEIHEALRDMRTVEDNR